jgi:hypothetical protein
MLYSLFLMVLILISIYLWRIIKFRNSPQNKMCGLDLINISSNEIKSNRECSTETY